VTQADLEGRIELLNDLAQKLGKHHDLTVLRATLKAVPESTLSKADRRQLRRTARAKQRSIDAELNAVLQGLAAASAATLRFELIGDLATDHATSTAHRNDPLTGQPGSGGAHGGD
jgi:CHAD domain-containing protein